MKKCECGGNLIKCEFGMGLFVNPYINIKDRWDFPKQHLLDSFVCEECGKITFYKKDDKEK